MSESSLSDEQRRLGPIPHWPRTRRDFRVIARWWEIEARRGYPSSAQSFEYAANMRWLVELMDNGVTVVGRRFDDIVRERKAAVVSQADYTRRRRGHAE